MKNIIEKIRKYYPMSDESLFALVNGFEECLFPSGENIICAGRLDKKVYFIERGMTRSYVLYNGKEVTTWFSMEGDAACGSWDLYRKRAGFEYVETLEDTLAYAISVDRLDSLYQSHIDIANWMRVLQQENFLRLQDIHISRLNLSATERYERLMTNCPEIFRRVGLGHIASFLGITRQSLSRIRARVIF